jgi:hypothetical protein
MLFFAVEFVESLVCPWHVSQRARYRGAEGV